MEQNLTTLLQQKWLSKMLGFEYIISYKKGKDNVAADALSRIHYREQQCNGLTVNKMGWKEELKDSLDGDASAEEIIAQLEVLGAAYDDYNLEGNLMKGTKYYVGTRLELKNKIILSLHDGTKGSFGDHCHL